MYLPGWKQREMVVKGEISSVELTQAALRRVRALDSQLNSFITVDEEGASGRRYCRRRGFGERR